MDLCRNALRKLGAALRPEINAAHKILQKPAKPTSGLP